MKRHRSFLIVMSTWITVCRCVNPTAVIQNDIREFKRQFPEQISTLKVASRRLQYAWSGDQRKRPLIFVHGSPGSWEGWAHFLLDAKLRESFHVIAVDRPGYGGSDPGRTERSLQKQAALITEVLRINQSGLPAILVGHSFGGPVVARMAMDYPKQVAGVVFVASSVAPDLEQTKWYQYPADWWPIRELIPSPLKVCNQEIYALKGELSEMLPLWKMFSAKVVTIQGQSDDLVPVGNQDFLLKMLDPKLVLKIDRVEGLNHFIPWQRPDLIFNGIDSLKNVMP